MREPLSILQVHLGPAVPAYLYDQVRQTRIFNPDTPLYLILDDGTPIDTTAVRELNMIVVRKGSIVRCKNNARFSRRNRLKRRGLGGFWLFASERFFAIESFLAACDLRNVVHMENDVMLYADLGSLLPAFLERSPRIGATMDSERRCIPGLVFIRDRDALSAMNRHIIDNSLRQRHTDMEALALFMAAAAPDACSPLPVVPAGYAGRFGLRSAEGVPGASPWYEAGFDRFGGVFDAAALGQYLGGIDTRGEERDTRGFINETAVYDPRNFNLHWKTESGLQRPYGTVGDVEFPVFNLHIHSKRLAEFSSVVE
jgi:hypothetical protein